MNSHTLIIPTYNRPGQLQRLLQSLRRQGLSSHVLIADSSTEANHAQNAGNAAACGLDARILRYREDTPPFEKFYQATTSVRSEFCSMCADDDFLVVRSMDPIIGHLRERTDCVAAHGWYYTFYETHQVGITSVAYKGAYEEHDALSRLRSMCSRYEAVTYAVYRTPIMADVLEQVRALPTILSKEFGAGTLTVVAGKVARVPELYYGRSLAPSEQYADWHPLEMLGTRPSSLFSDYVPYRAVLARRLAKAMNIAPERAEVLSDLAHLRYLCDYMKPQVLDYLFDQVGRQTPKGEMLRDAWPVLALANSNSSDHSLGKLLLRKVARMVLPEALQERIWSMLRGRVAAIRDGTHVSTTAGGQRREYLIYAAFLRELAGPLSTETCRRNLIAAMDTYD